MYTINPVFDELKFEELGSKGSLKGQTTHYIMLYSLVRCYRPRVAVEIGTLQGCSAAYIAQALKDNYEEGEGNIKGHLWTFDNQDEGRYPVQQYWEQCGLTDWVTQVLGDSRVEIPRIFDEKGPCITFAFLDGGHLMEFIEPDTYNIVKYSHPQDCVMVFHDTNRLEDCDIMFRRAKELGFEERLEIPAWNNLGVVRKGAKLHETYWGNRSKDF